MSIDLDNNLRTLYQELCTSYRAIDDFRGKLLGLLPLASAGGIFLLLGANVPANSTALVPIGVFGAIITMGLFCYELYGIKKCHRLIKAGKLIECELGAGGQFRNRPHEVGRLINEPFAAGVIYPAVLATWVFLALNSALPQGNVTSGIIAIVVFLLGLVITVIYSLTLRLEDKPNRSAIDYFRALFGRAATERPTSEMFVTKQLSEKYDYLAPDGSEISVLSVAARGSLAHCTLLAGKVSGPVAHRTVEEIWYCLSGEGEVWRGSDNCDEIVSIQTGTSVTIATGTRFQFRNTGSSPLCIVITTMPPWPGSQEAMPAEGIWDPKVER